MKILLLHIAFFMVLLYAQVCPAQKVEVSAGISGNFYNYTGNLSSLQNNYYSGVATDYYNSLPYGKKLTIGYGADINLKLIAKDGFIMGVGSGYDVLRSKSNLTFTFLDDYNPANNFIKYGYAVTTVKQINANPYLGYRLKGRTYCIDFLIGAEIAFFVENKQRTVFNGVYPTDYTVYYNSKDAITNSQDYRLKGGIGFNYRRFGINVSYARSVSNFYKDGGFTINQSSNTLYAQLIKIGLNYRLLP